MPDGGNHRIQVYTRTGVFIDQWGGPGTGASQFNHPIAVSSDAAGNLYVTDKDNHRIQKFGDLTTTTRNKSWGRVKRLWR